MLGYTNHVNSTEVLAQNVIDSGPVSGKEITKLEDAWYSLQTGKSLKFDSIHRTDFILLLFFFNKLLELN